MIMKNIIGMALLAICCLSCQPKVKVINVTASESCDTYTVLLDGK